MRNSTLQKETRSAEVIAFPSRAKAKAEPANMPAAPETGERPTLAPAGFRDWLRAALVVSIALHLIVLTVYLALQMKFTDDLERAAGAAAATSAEGSALLVPVEIVVEAALPPALAPTNASDAQAIAAPSPRKIEAAQAPQAPAAIEIIQHEARPSARTSKSAAASPAHAAASGIDGRAGASGETESGGRAAISSYQAQVLAHLSRYKVYPPEAQSRGIIGVSIVRFALAPDGHVLASSLARGSGATMLDEAAVAMVRRASPFPPFPPGLGRARMDFAAPIRFDLR